MIYILLRYDNPDGSSKDWSAEEENGGVRVRWGKTGRVNQSVFHPPGKYGQTPQDAIRVLAEKKLRKGYYEVTRGERIPDFSGQNTTRASRKPSKTAAALADWTGTESGLSWF
ncbi:hypothetical protein [Geothermobacter hydrogeniphilus]|uniref:WGR domain-containing protein n=1 Tax=Geothermobacter hydrogeniphilus TaxID=1969733 RepID=A0A1X0Y7Y5_9BACT|nr:hypothetical protein [Geothermobacter hydrogeniphilus]ORJ61321.1 hypothetical protein B5V00_06730 [Geothermobacter hydrogeniphilus]